MSMSIGVGLVVLLLNAKGSDPGAAAAATSRKHLAGALAHMKAAAKLQKQQAAEEQKAEDEYTEGEAAMVEAFAADKAAAPALRAHILVDMAKVWETRAALMTQEAEAQLKLAATEDSVIKVGQASAEAEHKAAAAEKDAAAGATEEAEAKGIDDEVKDLTAEAKSLRDEAAGEQELSKQFLAHAQLLRDEAKGIDPKVTD